MNALIFSSDASINGICICQLLGLGLNAISTDKIKRINDIVLEKKIQYLIIDIDNLNIDLKLFINSLRENLNNVNIYIIIFSSKKNKNKIIELIKESMINSVIYKEHCIEKSINKHITRIINSVNLTEKRKYLRINPDPNDNISVEINITNNFKKPFEADIYDISPSGIKINNKNEFLLLKNNESFINNIKITINDNDFNCNGIILRKNNDHVSIRYIEMDNSFKEAIAEYIHHKIIF